MWKFECKTDLVTTDPSSVSGLTVPAYAVGVSAVVLESTLLELVKLEDFGSALNLISFKSLLVPSRFGIQSRSIKKDDFGMSKSEKEYRFNIRRDVVAADMVLGTIISEYDVVLRKLCSRFV